MGSLPNHCSAVQGNVPNQGRAYTMHHCTLLLGTCYLRCVGSLYVSAFVFQLRIFFICIFCICVAYCLPLFCTFGVNNGGFDDRYNHKIRCLSHMWCFPVVGGVIFPVALRWKYDLMT